ncbi:MAG: 50S ribosomal protein L6, partial [Candidatus Omnitrophica bacterium]|nr:50S ribosomal protein L6 [Candidatus Omnitrophota bacterium]
MSRVGQRPIPVPAQVKVEIEERLVRVEGPKGKLSHEIPAGITLERAEAEILVKRANSEKRIKSLHGLTRTLVDNMVKGVTEGFMKELEIQGVGYRAQASGGKLELFVGFTHPVTYPVPAG